MLGLAKNQLSSTDYSQLAKEVPGIDKLSGGSGNLAALSGLLGQSGKSAGLENALGNVKNTNDLNNAFSALGMDSGMVGQFAPVLLNIWVTKASAVRCCKAWAASGAPAPVADSAALAAQFGDALIFLVPELVDPVLDGLAKRRIVLVIALPQRRVEFAGLDVDDHASARCR